MLDPSLDQQTHLIQTKMQCQFWFVTEQNCRNAQTDTAAPGSVAAELQRADVSTRDHGVTRMRPGLQRPPGLCTCPRLQRLPQHCQPAFSPDLVITCWSELQLQPGLLALPAWLSNASVTDQFFYVCAVLFIFPGQSSQPFRHLLTVQVLSAMMRCQLGLFRCSAVQSTVGCSKHRQQATLASYVYEEVACYCTQMAMLACLAHVHTINSHTTTHFLFRLMASWSRDNKKHSKYCTTTEQIQSLTK